MPHVLINLITTIKLLSVKKETSISGTHLQTEQEHCRACVRAAISRKIDYSALIAADCFLLPALK